MIKTGIYSLQQIESVDNFKRVCDGNKRFSITLYDQVLQLPTAEDLASRILLTFTDDRGAYKRTYTNRFDSFDAAILNLLRQKFDENATLILHDVGVSDGRTAVDFFNSLVNHVPNLQYIASDYDPVVYVIEQDDTKVTFGKDDKIIEIVWPPFVFNAARPDRYWHNPLNRFIQFFVTKLVVDPMVRKYKQGMLNKRAIYLFCPKAINLAKNDQRFKLLQHDVLNEFKASHVIRAMNIFNSSYFSTQEFNIILHNIHNALYSDGYLITGSNQDADSTVNGGIYRKLTNGFEIVQQFGSGSPIDHLITRTY